MLNWEKLQRKRFIILAIIIQNHPEEPKILKQQNTPPTSEAPTNKCVRGRLLSAIGKTGNTWLVVNTQISICKFLVMLGPFYTSSRQADLDTIL